ncbi:L,D-transpeptidase catalytic domain [Denitrobacterium detoxificans]|uniref:L,D-transpeptidase catalytic domain n=2 Tax=Denitrobacterium detoxificans TaxID=79604 RepID=A0A1H8TWB1_9ACTN|nr:L,D-transpeptidase catalytic domain [Denitrobacterium detoxificans]
MSWVGVIMANAYTQPHARTLRIGLAIAVCLLVVSLFCMADPAYALDDPADTQVDAVLDGSSDQAPAAQVSSQGEVANGVSSADNQKASAAQTNESAPAAQEGSAPVAGESDVSAATAAETPAVSVDEGANQSAADSSSQLAPASDAASQGDAAEPGLVVASDGETPSYEESHVNMYRLYNPNSGEHFYTSSESEAMNVASAGWQWEGIGWVAPTTSSTPVYRLYNPNGGDHFYTTSKSERDGLVKKGWKYEGIGWYSDSEDTGLVVYRQYNKNAKTGSHNYTTSASENASLVKKGWRAEGVAWYATNGANLPFAARWLVTTAWTGSLERYWIASDGSIAKSRLVTTSEGAGFTAYAKSNGAVVRGKWDNGAGYVYVANNDGKLASTSDGNTGWLVTKAYDGSYQRYYYDGVKHAMHSGFFKVDGTPYFGLGNQGYVLRGKQLYGNYMLLADNDGKMPSNAGWVVSKDYDGGVYQRYYMKSVFSGGYYGARKGYFTVDGSLYYGINDVYYVLRNGYVARNNELYHADNDGKITRSYDYSSAQLEMFLRAQSKSSSTGYLLMTDTSECWFGVMVGYKGFWQFKYFWRCVCGASDYRTPTGTWTTQTHERYLIWAGEPEMTSQWATKYTGPYAIHSILASKSELGQHLSHGCIRLEWKNAQWVYDNVPLGTTIHNYRP